MEKKFIFITFLILMVLSSGCFKNDNPLDENGTNYLPPKITLRNEASSFKNQDTIHIDSVYIALSGNRKQSIFNVKVDDNDWSEEWNPEGSFSFDDLSDGKHTLYINSMYRGGELIISDSVIFYVLTKGYKPGFSDTIDTTIWSFEEKTITISASATGFYPLSYVWLKGKSVLEGMNTDSLKFTSFSANDTNSYTCIVSNEYGIDTSRTFILKYHPYTGSIKGIITNSSGKKLENAAVTLLPSNKKGITDTVGFLNFSSLSANSYTLQICLQGYNDTTLSDIVVNDTEAVDLKTIVLKMIDTTRFMIAYDGHENDNGTIPSDSSKFTPGSRIIVAGIGDVSKTGYSFFNWNTKKDGTGNAVLPGDSFTINDNITFYAQWSINQYTISFNGNDNSAGFPPEKASYNYKEDVTVPDNGSLVKDGYIFNGWNTEKYGSGEAYKAGDKIIIGTTQVELIAQWLKAQFTITYHGNENTGGTVPPATSHLFQSDVTIPSDEPTKTGHSFTGWNTDSTGIGLDYEAGDKITVDKNIDLFARWTKNKYKVVYEGNGYDSGTVPRSVDYDYNEIVTTAVKGTMSRTGYSFEGWKRTKNGSDSIIEPGSIFTMGASDDTLFAQWSVKQYTVWFNTLEFFN